MEQRLCVDRTPVSEAKADGCSTADDHNIDDAATRLLTEPSKRLSLAQAIQAHRKARAALDAAAKNTDTVAMRRAGTVLSPTTLKQLEQTYETASDAEQYASDMVVHYRPTDATEAALQLRYLADEPHAIDQDEICTVLRNVADVLYALPNAALELSSRSSIPTPFSAFSDLAEACDWAVKHVVWINSECSGKGWGDERFNVEIAKHSEIWERAIAEPAASLSDLAAKARLFGEDWERHNPDDGSRDGLDRMMASILRDVAALEKAPLPLVDELLNAWGEWTKTCTNGSNSDDEESWKCNADIRDSLIDRAAALRATRENAPAKAIAQAWLEYVAVWHADTPREGYGIAGRLCLDIHDAVAGLTESRLISGRASKPMPGPPDFDIAGMKIRQLEGLHDVVQFVRELCSAVGCQPRCSNEKQEIQPAGEFVAWIADACDRLADAIHSEALSRPDCADDPRLTRLSILARFIVENDDANQRAAFVRDLSAVA
ncbi:hypothetical protein [Methylobacterium sp. CM6244]